MMHAPFLTRSLFSRAADLLYPPVCVACGCATGFSGAFRICGECLARVVWLDAKHTCRHCGLPLGPHRERSGARCAACRGSARYTHAFGAVRWGEVSSRLVHAYKFGGESCLACQMGAAMARRVAEEGAVQADVIVPVPLHPQRVWERGYDQAHLLAKRMGTLLGKPVVRALERTLYTTPQSRLGREERLRNLRGAFRARAGVGTFHTCLLVDDVMTTGTTLNECAAVLRGMGARRVEAAVFAR